MATTVKASGQYLFLQEKIVSTTVCVKNKNHVCVSHISVSFPSNSLIQVFWRIERQVLFYFIRFSLGTYTFAVK